MINPSHESTLIKPEDQTHPNEPHKSHEPQPIEEEQDDQEPEYEGESNIDQEYTSLDELLIALEQEFAVSHSPETAAELIKIYKDNDKDVEVRRIRDALLEYNTLSE